ncbi:protein spinster [Nilaparvata lugens]|uniref:protein spinster n=1 Tax=Nilaparvata lugens TaxID=108931 RepID=UPI00193D594F|nr:protein spinster [Nilaparvata lugens]
MPAQKFVDKHSLKILNMEPSGIPSNNSHQHLMNGDDGDSVDTIVPPLSAESREGAKDNRTIRSISFREWITVAVLCYVNLINYMDRYTIAGILDQIRTHFNISDDKVGLLQTAFVLSYMLFAPLFGYLGDRYSRRAIMAAGVFLWSLTTLLGSYMDNYYWFLFFRGLVGVGEASYSTIAPTIISDLFIKDMRSKMLALFYFAIPVGSGLGYIVGAKTADAMGMWQWALRVTPFMGALAVILILLLMQDPARGQSEGRTHLTASSWSNDIAHITSNASFMLSTAGFTCVAFVTGAMAWWGPQFIYYGIKLQPGRENTTLSDVAFNFGVIAMVAGLIGVPLGSALAQYLRPRFPKADPLICAFGLLLSAPLLFVASLCAGSNVNVTYVLIFFGQIFLNINWSIVADILLYVVTPTRRSTAEAFQILLSHALGDAGSPYLVGLLSEMFKKSLSMAPAAGMAVMGVGVATSYTPYSPKVEFHSLQYALFTTSFVEVLGGGFFLLTSLYVIQDRATAERDLSGQDNPAHPTHLYADDPHLRESVPELVTP